MMNKKKLRAQKKLQKVYYTIKGNPASLSGNPSVLATAAKVSKKEAEKWLKSQPTHTLHRAARKKYPTRKYYVNNIDEQWQADLCDVQDLAKYNDGHRYILTVIDILSRYGWAIPLKNKSANIVKEAFIKIFNKDNRIPQRIQTDQGKEFENKDVQKLMSDYRIELFSVKSAYKAAIVERWNRTLKNQLWKYFTAKNTFRWLDILPALVDNYNHRIHRTIQMKPANVTIENAMDVWNTLYDNSEKKKRNQVVVLKLENVFDCPK